MRYIFVLFVALMFPVCALCNADKYSQIQMMHAQINALQKTRAERYDMLVECEKNAKKFKIAGISAVSAAAIGFSVNVALQKKLASLRATSLSDIKSTDNRSEAQKCDDTVDMFCNNALPTYDADICKELSSGCV